MQPPLPGVRPSVLRQVRGHGHPGRPIGRPRGRHLPRLVRQLATHCQPHPLYRCLADPWRHKRAARRREHSRFCVDLAHEYADARRVSVARSSSGLLSSSDGGGSPVHASSVALAGVARQLLTLTVSPLDLPVYAVARWPVHAMLAQCRFGGSRMLFLLD